MSNLSVNQSGTIVVAGDNLRIVDNIEETQELLGQTLRTIRGEWFFDLDIGLPFFEVIVRKNPSIFDIESAIIEEALSVPTVIQLTAISSTYDSSSRSLAVDLTVQSFEKVFDFSLNFRI